MRCALDLRSTRDSTRWYISSLVRSDLSSLGCGIVTEFKQVAMPITIQCPGCGKSLRAKDELAGRVLACPACKGKIQVPQSSHAAAQPARARPAPARPKDKHLEAVAAPQAAAPGTSESAFPQINTADERTPSNSDAIAGQEDATSPPTEEKTKPPIPPWGWAFAAGCGLMPVATLGGAIPGAIGFGGAGACIGFARDAKRPAATRILICSSILVGVWSFFFALVVIPPIINAAKRAVTSKESREERKRETRTSSGTRDSRSSSNRSRDDFSDLPVQTVQEGAAPVDLLKLIDLERDRVSGDWRRVGSGLEASGVARLLIPCKPPAEYEIRIVAERTRGRADLILGLIAPNGKAFNACIDSWSGSSTGIALVNRKDVNSKDNPTRSNGPTLENDRRTSIVYTVRKDRVLVTVNSKSVVDWKPDYDHVARHGAWSMPRDDLLYIAVNHSSYRFTEMKLKPL